MLKFFKINTIKPIYLLGSIIHNKNVNQEFIKMGAIIIEDKNKTRLVSYPANKVGNVYEMPEGLTIVDELSFNRAGSIYTSVTTTGLNKIILASASPRRKQLLSTITTDFVIIPSNVEENFLYGACRL